MTDPVVIVGGEVVGGEVVATDAVATLRHLAVERRVGMLNTFAAKGLFAWNDPAHLGTIGLQERDLELAGLVDADVVLVGVPASELAREWLDGVGARWTEVTVRELGRSLGVNVEPTPRPPLYGALADVCGPLYGSQQSPMNPARAAADLAGWLPAGGVVAAHYDLAGFWLGRTFPTREVGSVRFGPDAHGVTLHVVSELDDALIESGAVVEHWSSDGPALGPGERLDRLATALRSGRGAVLPLGVDWSPLAALVAVAGSPLWG